MVVYSFYIFDRHGKPLHRLPISHSLISRLTCPPAECIYKKHWPPRPLSSGSRAAPRPASEASSELSNGVHGGGRRPPGLSAEDDAKLIFGTIFSLRNMVRKLAGADDNFISYRTGTYKLHYFETPTNLKFVMLTDTRMINLRHVLNQIYINLYVEFGASRRLTPGPRLRVFVE